MDVATLERIPMDLSAPRESKTFSRSRLMAPPSCRRRGVGAIFLAMIFTVAVSHGDEGGPSFGYTAGSYDGPERWGELSPKYRLCGEGVKQSPIDIVPANAISSPQLDTLARVYKPTNATLLNNGKDITMDFAGDEVGAITINYNNATKVLGLSKIHWHSPSEHTINGQRFPLEVHLVHVHDEDIAVISILYKIGDPDSFYDQLADQLRQLRTSREVAAGVVDLRSLEKRTGSYFRYMGSLTTPPCTEKVIWNVLGKARELSAEQLKALTAPLPAKDNRPPQRLYGRNVYFYHPPNSTVSFHTLSLH